MGVRVQLYLGHSWWKAEPILLLSLPYPFLIRKRYPFSAGLTERVFQSPHGAAEPRTHAIRRLSDHSRAALTTRPRRLSNQHSKKKKKKKGTDKPFFAKTFTADFQLVLKPVTPSRVSTALVRSCLILRSAVRSQENPDIFREKGPITASWRRLRRCYGARIAFYRVLTEFLLAIICPLTTLLLRFHNAHNVCTALSRRSHCADGVLKTFVSTTERSLCQFYVCSRKWNHAHKKGKEEGRERNAFGFLHRRLPRMMWTASAAFWNCWVCI